jgi:hypothetical protein
LEYFAANKWIRRPDIRIFRDFVANERIRRPDIRICYRYRFLVLVQYLRPRSL